jgi:hypothetical protein
MGVMERRMKPILEAGAVEGEKADYWYGAVDGFVGALWPQLFSEHFRAAECAKDLEGHVVIVAVRILEDEEGDQIEPAN